MLLLFIVSSVLIEIIKVNKDWEKNFFMCDFLI